MGDAYNLVADDYDKSFHFLPVRLFTEAHTVLKAVGNVEGLSVLDVACGTGFYARALRRSGAAKVVGVDLSADMIRVAKQAEAETQLGIEYHVVDAAKLPNLGTFDLTVAVHLLHYAPTQETLLGMCTGIARNLKKGARFVTFVMNPELPKDSTVYHPYGFFMRDPEPHFDGNPLHFAVMLGDLRSPEFTAYHHSKSTIESALTQAGFSEITWQRPTASSEGMQRFGQTFFDGYLQNPHCLLIDCRRS